MKLEQPVIDCLKNVIDASNVAKINSFILEKGVIRGIDEAKRVIIWQTENVPELPFGSLGINRLSIFASRFNLGYGQTNFTVDAIISDRDNAVSQLVFKCTGTKIECRCANPKAVLAPKTMSDTISYSVQFSPETIQFLTRAEAAMDTEFVTFISNDSGIRFELIDTGGDVLSHTFADGAINLIGGTETTFASRYPIKTVLPLFKKITDGRFSVGKKGMLKVTISNMDLYVLPQV